MSSIIFKLLNISAFSEVLSLLIAVFVQVPIYVVHRFEVLKRVGP